MTNYLFKSGQKPDLQIIRNQLEFLLAEQRNQRHDLKQLQISINKLSHNKDLQDTVDKYFDETSHQTDSDDSLD